MKNFLFILVIIWFVVGASAANDRGFFDPGKPIEDYTEKERKW